MTRPPRHRHPFRAAAAVAIGVVIFGLYIWGTQSAVQRAAPPAAVTDLPTFLQHRPTPQRAHALEIGGERFIELIGPLPPTWSLPSGPPAYVFEEKSRQLVDWTADDGDDPAYASKWRSAGRRELNAQELKALLGDSRPGAAAPE